MAERRSVSAYIDDNVADQIDEIKKVLRWEQSDSKLLIKLIGFAFENKNMLKSDSTLDNVSGNLAMVRLMIAMLEGDVARNEVDAMNYLRGTKHE